jgi:hypothetical protein
MINVGIAYRQTFCPGVVWLITLAAAAIITYTADIRHMKDIFALCYFLLIIIASEAFGYIWGKIIFGATYYGGCLENGDPSIQQLSACWVEGVVARYTRIGVVKVWPIIDACVASIASVPAQDIFPRLTQPTPSTSGSKLGAIIVNIRASIPPIIIIGACRDQLRIGFAQGARTTYIPHRKLPCASSA